MSITFRALAILHLCAPNWSDNQKHSFGCIWAICCYVHAMPSTRNHTLLQWAWMRQQWTRHALVAHCIYSPHQDRAWQVVRDEVTIEASMFLIGI